MEYMATVPDKYFDLAIVDPEFGIGIGKSPRLVTDKGLKAKDWDNKPIDMKYFDEVFRTSKQQIIWGAITTHSHQQSTALFGTRNSLKS